MSKTPIKRIHYFFLSIAFALVPFAVLATAQHTEEWVARYNGPANSYDMIYDMAVYTNGDSCVTGYTAGTSTETDYATVMFDKDGNQEWASIYNGTGNNEDFGRAVVFANGGDPVVTGYSDGDGTDGDYVTIRYDKNDGSEKWISRYDGPGNGTDTAYSVAADTSGDVYVTGLSYGTSTDYDYATIKYDKNSGDEEWVRRYDGPGNGFDVARAVIADNQGYVYVTGYGDGDGTNYDFATIKYDEDGNEEWVKRYDGPMHGDDVARAITLDNQYNVYVTGYSPDDGTKNDIVTIKYDEDGNEEWAKRYDAPVHGGDNGYSIAVDNQRNVYVTGGSDGGASSYDYITIKYDEDGNEEWVRRYDTGNNADISFNLVVDSTRNIYITGQSYNSATSYDYVTVKYDEDGNELWVARYDGPVSDHDESYDLGLDAAGDLYVTGRSVGDGTDWDYATLKYYPKNTAEGEDVEVTLNEAGTVTATFEDVTDAGDTSMTATTTAPIPPTGFELLDTYYDITTNASYASSVTISITYDDEGLTQEEEEALALMHWNASSTEWEDVTDDGYPDTENNIIQGTVTSLSPFAIMFPTAIPSIVDIDPDTINLEGANPWILAYIELPEGYDVADIDLGSVLLNGTVPAEAYCSYVGDHDGDGIPDLKLTFSKAVASDTLEVGEEVVVGVIGEVNGTVFIGEDTVEVVSESGPRPPPYPFWRWRFRFMPRMPFGFYQTHPFMYAWKRWW